MLKIAIFYDWLNQWGGAEKVLLDILEIYPQADIFTIVYDPKTSSWLPKKHSITTSFINRLPFANNNPIFYTPLYDLALEQFNFSQYDILISTTSTVGHCFITSPQTLYITYFHNINRYLYQTPGHYKFLMPLLNIYKKIDKVYSQRPDHLLCNCQNVAQRIIDAYGITPKIIYPGVDTDFFKPVSKSGVGYYLAVSRFVPHKKIDIVIEAFRQNKQELVVVGTGRDFDSIKARTKDCQNIKLVDSVEQNQLLKLYQNCISLICPQLEDFGLTALEAQACGKPVLAYGQGGYLETVIDKITGLHFPTQSAECLNKYLDKMNTISFDPQACIKNAKRFSRQSFMLNFKETVNKLWQKHQTIFS